MIGIADAVGLADLRPALLRIDLRLRLAVDSLRNEIVERARDPFRGLYISEDIVDELLSSAPASDVASQILAGPASAVSPRLERLSRLVGLDDLEQEILLICLAPDLDLRYERLYGYLQDDVTRRRPTADLVIRLLESSFDDRVRGRQALGSSGRLARSGLLLCGDEATAQLPLLARPLRAEERVVEYLLGSDEPDARIAPWVDVISPNRSTTDESFLPRDVQESLTRLTGTVSSEAGPIIYLQSVSRVTRLSAAKVTCQEANRPLLLVDLEALMAAGKTAQALSLVFREAILQDAVLGLEGFDRLLAEDAEHTMARSLIRQFLVARPSATLLLGESRWEPVTWLPEITSIRVELPPIGPGARLRLWRSQMDGRVSPEDVAALAARFRLDSDAIRGVIASARSRAIWRGDGVPGPDDYRAAARAIAAPPLDGLARRIEPRYGWEDIVLTSDGLAQLGELCSRARLQTKVLEDWGFGRKLARRSGLTALFAGQPGTGKTMAAEIVAGALGLELYRIDLSAVVSKYIGETEKNLERIFRAADLGDAVLLFDEADALFGKRSEVRDAHDRYANVETAYLLQRLESYDGLAVLTTNLRGNIDEAFVRRLDFVLEFSMPEEAERLAIWRRSLPNEAPLAQGVDLPFLARKFKLSGGHIRNIALGAAFLAAGDGEEISMKHLVRATRREYQKIGKLVAEADFEIYFEHLSTGQQIYA